MSKLSPQFAANVVIQSIAEIETSIGWAVQQHDAEKDNAMLRGEQNTDETMLDDYLLSEAGRESTRFNNAIDALCKIAEGWGFDITPLVHLRRVWNPLIGTTITMPLEAEVLLKRLRIKADELKEQAHLHNPDDSDAAGNPEKKRGKLAHLQINQKSKLRMPSDIALAAFRVHIATGRPQAEIAAVLQEKYRRPVKQNQVSRWIKQAERFVERGGILPPLPKTAKPARSVDPADIEMGERLDRRTPRQRKAGEDSD